MVFFHTTCKLLVPVASATELGDEFAGQLEDEDRACLVVNYDHMTVLVHGHTLRSHQSTRAKLGLMNATSITKKVDISQCDFGQLVFMITGS